jgi:hypothetical protein
MTLLLKDRGRGIPGALQPIHVTSFSRRATRILTDGRDVHARLPASVYSAKQNLAAMVGAAQAQASPHLQDEVRKDLSKDIAPSDVFLFCCLSLSGSAAAPIYLFDMHQTWWHRQMPLY